jgi:hypothetical protein
VTGNNLGLRRSARSHRLPAWVVTQGRPAGAGRRNCSHAGKSRYRSRSGDRRSQEASLAGLTPVAFSYWPVVSPPVCLTCLPS